MIKSLVHSVEQNPMKGEHHACLAHHCLPASGMGETFNKYSLNACECLARRPMPSPALGHSLFSRVDVFHGSHQPLGNIYFSLAGIQGFTDLSPIAFSNCTL